MNLRIQEVGRLLGRAALAAVLAVGGAATAQIRPETISTGLENPWGVAFLPGGRFVVTERAGRLRLIAADGKIGAPIAGLPAIAAGGQGGLLDVVADSGFDKNRTLYFCFSEPAGGGGAGNGTALASTQLSADGTRLENLKIIFSQQPKVASRHHFGCRIVEARDGTLFLTLGERFSRKEDAQKLDNHLGKVVRIAKDGSAPGDNPFVGRAGALPEIWSYGHRNGQGAALAPDGRFWMTEHGPQGGDEINIPQAGRNYGWPVITYGENYGGGKIGEGITARDGMEQPLHYWVPSIAPSGMAFLTSDRYGAAWKGNLFVGSLKFGYLDRIELKDGKVVAEHKLLADDRARIRDVKQGPDGLLYVLTDESDGKLLRLRPN
ncbi:glucose/arabinose dehydrogenase [Variovorax paradoxus]|uniref:Glucose/arabinose dehydrogenase n=1 Tax=Variovorax paradoxus TaxID=34073 RepID=A0AAE3Y475_VARPD|nr:MULTISPECIES: PQQ-dependent sugar dehydrogenase [Variovorax]MBD9668246.1 PQQ-dependent sugar dehydrogenase [Variovorax sp. VRV01]MDP9967625.1 glucose/arabinose dehydrogenase [Variovorax paradoxus]MDR6429240.1 glucose/arabinose dehydrogenase [Variovorax paradoxus]MDR6454027.1 glucose/arabinose dehydrogenase [Variovorax paradoxus]